MRARRPPTGSRLPEPGEPPLEPGSISLSVARAASSSLRDERRARPGGGEPAVGAAVHCAGAPIRLADAVCLRIDAKILTAALHDSKMAQ